VSEPTSTGPETPASQQSQPTGLLLNDRDAELIYSNLVGVRLTPDELILDFAFDALPYIPGKREVRVSHRVALTLPTAKRFFNTLAMALQRHEARYGVIDPEPGRRAAGPATNLFGAPLQPEGGTK
jgi:hypothetical protein